jgi:hypothetical protein
MHWKPHGLRVFVVAVLALPLLAPVAKPFAKGGSFHVIAVRVDASTSLFYACEPGARSAPTRVYPGLHLARTGDPSRLPLIGPSDDGCCCRSRHRLAGIRRN